MKMPDNQSDDTPPWKKLLEQAPEHDQPTVGNALEYTYVINGTGKSATFSINEAGEKRADLSFNILSLISRQMAVNWVDSEPSTFTQYTDGYPQDVPTMRCFKLKSGNEDVAMFASATRVANGLLMVKGTDDAAFKRAGTRIQLWLDGKLAGETAPVWRDSDADRGIQVRIFVDQMLPLQRISAMVLIMLGVLDRSGLSF